MYSFFKHLGLHRIDHPVGLVLFVLLSGTAGVMAVLFVVEESVRWDEMNLFLFIGTTALFTAVLIYAYYTKSLRNTLFLFVLSCLISLIAEYAGTHSNLPFGHRCVYHPNIQPMLFGHIPMVIPLAWFMIGFTPLVFLKRYHVYKERPHHMYKRIVKVSLCALYMVGLDLFIDPLAISVTAWTWETNGVYFGVPATNFVGWFFVGFIIHAVYTLFEKGNRKAPEKSSYVFEGSFMLISMTMTGMGWVTFVFRLGFHPVMLLPLLILVPFWVYGLMSITGFNEPKKS